LNSATKSHQEQTVISALTSYLLMLGSFICKVGLTHYKSMSNKLLTAPLASPSHATFWAADGEKFGKALPPNLGQN
jgi:hypothetical protein